VPYADFTGNGESEADVLAALADMYPVMPPNRRFHYSNLGVGLLGRALGHAANESLYEDLLAEKVTQPLGMANATFDTASAMAADLVAVGSGGDGGELNLTATCEPDAPFFAAREPFLGARRPPPELLPRRASR